MADFDPGRYYYSAHHIARDFVATAAPLTLACLAAYAALPPARQAVDKFLSRIPAAPIWIMLIIAVVAYCLFALVCGAIANKTALLIRFIPGLSRRLEFDEFYRNANASIEAWRNAYLPEHRELWVNDATKREETIDRLVSFFQIYNPSGFLHVYREYAFVFMYRQVVTYAAVLFAYATALQAWSSSLTFLVVFVLATKALIGSVRECVEAEYKFIVSTGSWLDRERQSIGNAPGRGTA
jgi:predicted PurR-regulated permease PerM